MEKFGLKLQISFSVSSIVLAVIMFVFSLGFMTDYFTLFMDGNSEMYEFFKNIQILNRGLFSSSLLFLILSLLLVSFDINKKTAGLFGVLFTMAIFVINTINGISIFTLNNHFRAVYMQLDYSILPDYSINTLPFQAVMALYTCCICVAALLFVITLYNFLMNGKKGK